MKFTNEMVKDPITTWEERATSRRRNHRQVLFKKHRNKSWNRPNEFKSGPVLTKKHPNNLKKHTPTPVPEYHNKKNENVTVEYLMDKSLEKDLLENSNEIRNITNNYIKEWQQLKFEPKLFKSSTLSTVFALLNYIKKSWVGDDISTEEQLTRMGLAISCILFELVENMNNLDDSFTHSNLHNKINELENKTEDAFRRSRDSHQLDLEDLKRAIENIKSSSMKFNGHKSTSSLLPSSPKPPCEMDATMEYEDSCNPWRLMKHRMDATKATAFIFGNEIDNNGVIRNKCPYNKKSSYHPTKYRKFELINNEFVETQTIEWTTPHNNFRANQPRYNRGYRNQYDYQDYPGWHNYRQRYNGKVDKGYIYEEVPTYWHF